MKPRRLPGIRTVDDLRARCEVDPKSKCWHWCLSMTETSPRVCILHPVTGKEYITTGSNAAYVLSHGHCVHSGRNAYRKCQTFDCVNPAHVIAWTPTEFGRFLARDGRRRGDPSRRLHSIAAGRSRSPLDMTKAREIRRSDETAKVLAARYGVSSSTITGVRRGESWREATATAPNSVFAWAQL